MPKYSIIIPVYNRPNEMVEMLDSLVLQSRKDFEVIVVEDGSDAKSDHVIGQYDLDIKYFFKPNTGPGDSRNYGMEKSVGEYLLFFDSDCVLPSDYFESLDDGLSEFAPDAFGGPDAAHESFSSVQKAINYTMTSFFTTGGIRGGKRQLDTYQPRSFNMGMKREVYQVVGGFSNIHPGEDPDLSFRIMNAGFKVGLISKAFVYHKRRIDFRKFGTQVYKFGIVRGILNRWHPGTGKLVYALPSFFLLGVFAVVLGSLFWTKYLMLVLISYSVLVFVGASLSNNSLLVSLMAIPAAFIQLMGYGIGYLKSWWKLKILSQKERLAFPSFFFDRHIV